MEMNYIKLTDWFFITKMRSVYCAVRTESLYKTDKRRLQKVKYIKTNLFKMVIKKGKKKG
jgi:hypothetical protein